VGVEPQDRYDFQVVALPPIETAATIIHHGSMEEVGSTFQTLAHWIDDNGYRSKGLARELSLHCPDDVAEWVTELQMEVTPA
jgi:effector-binding domain-containing protein